MPIDSCRYHREWMSLQTLLLKTTESTKMVLARHSQLLSQVSPASSRAFPKFESYGMLETAHPWDGKSKMQLWGFMESVV